ncbi:MAG: GAF domain-containing sensor histidine kinase [Cyanobacteria bacterium J06627_28]
MIYGTSANTNEMAKEMTSAASQHVQAKLSCFLDGMLPAERDQARVEALSRLNLLGNESVPVFDEATQQLSRLLAMPICLLSVIDAESQWFKSVVGLSSLGLMNQLAAARRLPRKESFCTHVIDSGKTFALEDATAHPAFSHSVLVQQYGIQSYLGVPLITTEGECIGTLAVMDLLPHQFTQQEIAFLELSARWSMSEFEKQQVMDTLQRTLSHSRLSASGIAGSGLSGKGGIGAGGIGVGGIGTDNALLQANSESSLLSKVNQVRFDLIVQLTQELRNPLTSVTGMANMLSREIYGPLSEKQQEYAKIVLSSSQQLLTMVNEIVEIGDLKEDGYQLTVATADIEMIGQQALVSLESIAKQQDLEIKLTVEPGSRIWNLDKRIVKQLIYHLVFSIIKMSTAGSTIRLHVSRKDNSANIALWVSNPWLGEDLPQAVIAWSQRHSNQNAAGRLSASRFSATDAARPSESGFAAQSGEAFEALATAQKVDSSRQELGLLLSRHLTEVHGGETSVQGSNASGYRYIITLPSLSPSA